MKRLFAAVRINPDNAFLVQFHQLQRQLQHERIKWVEEHNIHITLKFFGEISEEMIPDISKVLDKVAEDSCTFSFSLQGLGIFGSSYDPRVIWVGVEPFTELSSLMGTLRERMGTIGFEPDRQNLVPHLTLGRIKFLKDKTLFQRVIDQNKEISSQEIKIDCLILFESILKKEGPEYRTLHTFQLKKQNP
ncbi:MAG: RNA 2',3'-cyclic phosphodiesterase [Bacteroidetes bacterium]|nr:RNA 2',3'-cyclic phosphodiesterase [Bacteroidota bacterium]